MNIKICLAISVLVMLVGCGGGSSKNSTSASTSQISFEKEQSDSQIATIYLNDDSIMKVNMEDTDLNSSQLTLRLPQIYVSNVVYGSDHIEFVRTFYDHFQNVVRFTHFYDYPDNTYAQQELGYDLTRKKLVYINDFGTGEMGPIVDLNDFSTKGVIDGIWEGNCVHDVEQNESRITYESYLMRRLEFSGSDIKISTYDNCRTTQLIKSYQGKFDSKVMYDEFSKRDVIVMKDPETDSKHMAPKRFLISSDGKKMIRFFGVNTYVVYTKIN